jgi:hypothetical protein
MKLDLREGDVAEEVVAGEVNPIMASLEDL